MTGPFAKRNQWIFCVVTMAVWLVVGWPVLLASIDALGKGSSPGAALWLGAFALFGAAALGAMVRKLSARLRWALIGLQVAAVMALAYLAQWAMMSVFLIIPAWQAAMTTTPARALGWVAFQMLAVIAALAVAPNPDICWVLAKAFGLQLLLVFIAFALRWESESARALAQTNRELRSAQAIVAGIARDSERLRISRELHDAWGHELTALGLQLEIASHVTGPGPANDHVLRAKVQARDLLAKVRTVVATLREADRCDLKDALEALAQSVAAPAIHVEIAADVRLAPDELDALIRCAQEAVTTAIDEADAANLWLRVDPDGDGVRLVARDDGRPRPGASDPGAGLLGLRERIERLGGRFAVRTGAGVGRAVEAWLPARHPQTA